MPLESAGGCRWSGFTGGFNFCPPDSLQTSETFPTALQILKVLHKFSLQWAAFLPASEEHGLLALETLLAAFIRTHLPLNSALTVESPSSWGQTLTLRGKVVTCNAAVGCQWQCVSLMHRQWDKHPSCVWSPLADLTLKTFYMSRSRKLRELGKCQMGLWNIKGCHTMNTGGGTQVAHVQQHPDKRAAVLLFFFLFAMTHDFRARSCSPQGWEGGCKPQELLRAVSGLKTRYWLSTTY